MACEDVHEHSKIRVISYKESSEGYCLQGEAALQLHSFRDAEPQHVIPPNAKKNHGTYTTDPAYI